MGENMPCCALRLRCAHDQIQISQGCTNLIGRELAIHIGKFPETGEEAAPGAFATGVTGSTVQEKGGSFLNTTGLLCCLDRIIELFAARMCSAYSGERAAAAKRDAVWRADGFTEFHDRFCEQCRLFARGIMLPKQIRDPVFC